jgi:hypothetical protein
MQPNAAANNPIARLLAELEQRELKLAAEAWAEIQLHEEEMSSLLEDGLMATFQVKDLSWLDVETFLKAKGLHGFVRASWSGEGQLDEPTRYAYEYIVADYADEEFPFPMIGTDNWQSWDFFRNEKHCIEFLQKVNAASVILCRKIEANELAAFREEQDEQPDNVLRRRVIVFLSTHTFDGWLAEHNGKYTNLEVTYSDGAYSVMYTGRLLQ